MIKTLFIGSNWEALETLKVLKQDPRFEIVGVITQPSKPVGRKQTVEETEIISFSKINKIPTFTDDNYKKIADELDYDLIVCKSFGRILPSWFLKNAINVHYSLLPKYRGAVPIQKAIMEGETETGISIVLMGRKLDAGDILYQAKEKILPNDTNESLRKRLVALTGQVLPNILVKWQEGKVTPTPQDEKLASYCYREDISKDNAFIDFLNMSTDRVERIVRAMIPWPIAWTVLPNGKRMKIFEGKVVERKMVDDIEIDGKRLFFRCEDGCYECLVVQVEGGKRLNVETLLNGNLLKN
jgi:methionyl-tRNA formyltransferase